MTDSETSREKLFLGVSVFVTFILLLILSGLSDGSYGGADSYVHYRIARYAPQHPEFFLDNWGKPLFTLFSSPFAQFGFYGIKLFNILVTLCSAWCCYLIAKKLHLKFAAAAIVLLCYAPMYFMLSMTGLTETFFSFVIVLSVYFFFKQNFFLAAFVISLSPFARQEGCLFMIFFLFALVYRKKFKAIPFLLSGFVIYGIASYFMFGDFLWIINNVPYTGKAEYYGHGEFFHFIKHLPEITGYPLLILLLAGLSALTVQLFFQKKKEQHFLAEKILLIALPALAYLCVHSVLWWKGLSGSLGLTRVMAAVLPLMVVTGLDGFNLLSDSIKDSKISNRLLTLLLITSISAPFFTFKFPVHLDEPQMQMKQCAEWLKAEHLDGKMLYYYDPFLVYLLGKNPYDITQVRERVPHADHPSSEIASGSIVVWDSHFGSNEGRLPLATLQADSGLTVLKQFSPSFEMKTLGGYEYLIVVLEKK